MNLAVSGDVNAKKRNTALIAMKPNEPLTLQSPSQPSVQAGRGSETIQEAA